MKKHFLKSFALLAMLFSALTMSAESPWCNRVIGHLDPNGVGDKDDKSYVRLTVQDNQDGTISFIVAVDPTLPKAAPDVDYVLINPGIGTAGDDATALESQTVKYSVPAGTEKITVEILWSYSNWAGRYMVQNLEIPLSEICGASDSGEGGEDPVEPTPDPTVTPGYSAGAGVDYTYLYTNDNAGNVYLWVTFNEALVGVAGPQFYTDGNVAIEAITTDNKVFYTSVSGKKDGDVVKLRARIPRAGGLSETPLLSHTVGTESGLIVTEYCNYTNNQLTKNGASITLSWETVDNGDVVITMGNGVGTTSCSYRNGGFEGGIEAFVVSTDNFATTTPASDYFTFEKVYSGNEARLVKIANLPKGAKIKHIGVGHALAWVVNGTNEYYFLDFIYTYGGVCNNLDAPTNVAVTDAGVLTFEGVEGADTYEVHVYLGDVLKHTQDIVSGGTINFLAYVAGTYTVKVIAKGAGKGDSEESDPASWNMQASPLPGSNYCETPADRITANQGPCNPLFTWITDASGNVVITVSASEGNEGETMFRNNGMNGAFSLDGSVENFNAYFDRGKTDDYTYTLTLKDAANKPALGSVISFSGQIEAKSSINVNDWSNYEFDGYLYGTKCATLDAPTNVAITSAGVLTFDAVEGADSYLVHVYDGATLKLEATIASGNTVEFYSFIDKTYQVCVVAKAGSAKSEESNKVDWALTAAFLNTPSEYCEQVVTSGANSVIFDWQTNAEGSIIIKISEADGGADGTTHFRAQGMSPADLNKFKIGESREAANLYFERVYTENEQVYELRLKAGKQLAPGTKIYHTGDVEFVSESEGTNAYHNYGFEYTYGTRCVGYQVSATPADPAMGSAVVKQNGVEVTSVEGGTVQFIATPAEGCVFVNWTKNGVEVSTAATYETEITATTRLVANFDYIRTIYCQQEVLTDAGKKVYLTVGQAPTAGKYQIKIEGTADLTIIGLYNANTMINNVKYTTEGGTPYDGNDVPFTIENGGWTFSNEGYGVITSAEFEPSTGKTWKDMWIWQPALVFLTNSAPDIQNINDVLNQRNHFDWSYKCEDDTEKPVMGTASLVSASYSDALIAVSATDNRKVEKYHIVETAHSIDVTMMPTDGQVLISGLTANTAYTFVITAIDFAGNESANNASVSCTTQAHVLEPTSLPEVPTLPENQVRAVYSDTYYANCNFGDWGSATQYTQETYGKKFVTTELGYFGLVDMALNCSKMEALHLDVWSAESFTLRVVPIHGGAEVGVTKTIMGGQWNDIDIALSEFVGVENWSNVYQIKIDNAPNQTFWLNNIYFYTTQVSSDVTPPANLKATAIPSFTTAVIECSATDESGSVNFKVMYGPEQKAVGSADSGATARLNITNLQAGSKFTMTVIATDVYGNEAAEPINVTFTTLAYPVPAPTPIWTEENVFSIYSDAYVPKANRAFGWWGASTVEAEAELAIGDNALLYTTSTYLGWSLNNDQTIGDISAYPYFHMDIYVENAGSIQFTPIWGAEALKTYTLQAGWNSIDIDLTAEFTGINLANIYQLKWADMPATCFIDNVYFYKEVHQEVTESLEITEDYAYTSLTITEDGKVTISNDATLTVKDFVIQSTMGAGESGQLLGATIDNFDVIGDAYIDITLGKDAAADQWHAFTVPFPVNALNGIYKTDGTKLRNEVDYAIMDYHGDIRANGKYGWKKYRGDLVPGTFYIMTVNGDIKTFRFKKTDGSSIVTANNKALVAHNGSGTDTDKGWNGVGNPTLAYGSVAQAVQVLNPVTYTYEAHEANATNFTVGTPFFIQAASNGNMTMAVADASKPSYAPARQQTTEVKAKVYLSNDNYTDRLYITATDDATATYEIGKDLVKMTMTNTPNVPQLFARAYNTDLCMIHTPLSNNEAMVALNLYAPAAGEYTLSAEAQNGETIYLLKDNAIIWNLTASEYTIDLSQGNTEVYSVIIKRAPQVETGVENGATIQTLPSKVILQGNLYIFHNGQVYDATGKCVK